MPHSKFKRGQKPNFVLLDNDKLIIKAVHSYRFLTAEQIHRLLPSIKYRSLLKRLKYLFDSRYLDRPKIQQQIFAYTKRRPLVHALGDYGAKWLSYEMNIAMPNSVEWNDKNNKVKGEHFFLHTLGIAEFITRVQYALNQKENFEFIDMEYILCKSPLSIQKLEKPWSMQITFPWQGYGMASRYIEADYCFAIKRVEDQKSAYFFVEYDRGSIPLFRKDPKISSILQKMVIYNQIYRLKLCKERYNMPNFRILFVTPKKERAKNMQELYMTHLKDIAPANLFLFISEEGYSDDFLNMIWKNGIGEDVKLAGK